MAEHHQLNRRLGTASVLWQLGDLYPSADHPLLAEDCRKAEAEAQAIRAAAYARVAEMDATELFALVRRLEELDCLLARLATYSFLNFTTAMDDAAAGRLDQEIRELCSRCHRETLFFQLEWNRIDDGKAEKLLADNQLNHYRHHLLSLRRYRPHQLSEQEEQLLAELEPVGRSSWTTLFDKVLSTISFGERQRTEEEVLSDLYHHEREVRQAAATDLTAGLRSHSHILTHIFNTLAAEKMIADRLRQHQGWLGAMNLENELRNSTVDALVQAVTSRYDLVQRYYRVKSRLLGLDQLEDYDRYAPLPSLPRLEIDWESCRKTVLAAFHHFSPEMAEIAGRFFAEKWIHAPVAPGKRGGAFAHPCVPSAHPYVLVNYTGSLRDVATVAHELGHGVHQKLAASQGYYNSDTSLPLAETASVFAELLVFKSQLKMLTDQGERRALICQKLESIFATVFRQTAMHRFEGLMHDGRRQQGELSQEQLGEYWLRTQQEMFGDAVHLGSDYRIWWCYIPHFLSTPGYVYSYAFGELLVLALYGLYQQEGQAFVTRYLELLAKGGSRSPDELLEPFAIDLDDPKFWETGLAVIEEMLSQVE
jgi:oligoendopeptidase F